MKFLTVLLAVLLAVFLASWNANLLGQTAATGQGGDAQARTFYESGLESLRKHSYSQALQDFETVAKSYPTSSVAGAAQIEIARYQLENAHDLPAAQAAAEIVRSRYATSSAAPQAYVLIGRIALEKGRTPTDVDSAVESFDRVLRFYPYSEAAPSAVFYAGEAYRLARRDEAALARYRDVGLRSPRSVWHARALLAASECLTQMGRPVDAMEVLQQVRDGFPNTPFAATALNWNTILYRLYVRPPDVSYVFSGRTLGSPATRFRDVAGVSVDVQDHVLLAHKMAITEFDGNGVVVRSIPVTDPSAFAIAADGSPVSVRQGTLSVEGKPAIPLRITRTDRVAPIEEVSAIINSSKGGWIVADRKGRALHAFSEGGKYIKVFAAVTADRLARNDVDDVAVLDRESKGVTVLDRDGKRLWQVPTRGAGYQLEEPIDVAFDRIGHLYILDRVKGAVFVFGAEARLVGTFSIAERSPGAFRRALAFTLDSAGRLFIFDERVQAVQIYQ